MKQPLKENGGLPASILWPLAIVAGISVANLYYNQPLLNMIRQELGVSGGCSVNDPTKQIIKPFNKKIKASYEIRSK